MALIPHPSYLIPAFIGLGSNIGDPPAQIRRAMQTLAAMPETRLVRQSSLYRNPPAGYLDQPEFVNAVAEIETLLARETELERKLESLQGSVKSLTETGPQSQAQVAREITARANCIGGGCSS